MPRNTVVCMKVRGERILYYTYRKMGIQSGKN